jgi:hypothetical protein
MFMWFWHLALHVLLFSPCIIVLYCSMLKARKFSIILSGKSQMKEIMVSSKSVSSSQSLTETVKRREKCSVGIQKHQGAVVQLACTFILLVVSCNKHLQSFEEQDCKLYPFWNGTKEYVGSLMLVRKFGLPWAYSHETRKSVMVVCAVSCTEIHPDQTGNEESADGNSLSKIWLSLCPFSGISRRNWSDCCEFYPSWTKCWKVKHNI